MKRRRKHLELVGMGGGGGGKKEGTERKKTLKKKDQNHWPLCVN